MERGHSFDADISEQNMQMDARFKKHRASSDTLTDPIPGMSHHLHSTPTEEKAHVCHNQGPNLDGQEDEVVPHLQLSNDLHDFYLEVIDLSNADPSDSFQTDQKNVYHKTFEVEKISANTQSQLLNRSFRVPSRMEFQWKMFTSHCFQLMTCLHHMCSPYIRILFPLHCMNS